MLMAAWGKRVHEAGTKRVTFIFLGRQGVGLIRLGIYKSSSRSASTGLWVHFTLTVHSLPVTPFCAGRVKIGVRRFGLRWV